MTCLKSLINIPIQKMTSPNPLLFLEHDTILVITFSFVYKHDFKTFPYPFYYFSSMIWTSEVLFFFMTYRSLFFPLYFLIVRRISSAFVCSLCLRIHAQREASLAAPRPDSPTMHAAVRPPETRYPGGRRASVSFYISLFLLSPSYSAPLHRGLLSCVYFPFSYFFFSLFFFFLFVIFIFFPLFISPHIFCLVVFFFFPLSLHVISAASRGQFG